MIYMLYVFRMLGGVVLFAFLVYYFSRNAGSIHHTGRSEKPAAAATAVEESVNPMLSNKSQAKTDVELSSTTYQKQSAASAVKPDVSATVGDDNM